MIVKIGYLPVSSGAQSTTSMMDQIQMVIIQKIAPLIITTSTTFRRLRAILDHVGVTAWRRLEYDTARRSTSNLL